MVVSGEGKAKPGADPGIRGAWPVIGMVTVPMLLLCWLLWGTWQRHERQASDAQAVIDVYRAGLEALPPLDRMRALGRTAFASEPRDDVRRHYDDAQAQAQAAIDRFLERVGARSKSVPTLVASVDRLQQLPPLGQITIDYDSDTAGPAPAISRHADGIHYLLSAVLYSADLPDRASAASTELLMLVPDTLRRLRHELSVLQMLVLPGDLPAGMQHSDDYRETDRAWNAVIELGDLLESQLRDLEQRQGELPAGQDSGQIDEIRDYAGFVEEHLILRDDTIDWQSAWDAGDGAVVALGAIEGGLVDVAARRLSMAQSEQRRFDLLVAGGLVLLYAAILFFAVQYYRSRVAAMRERELQREIEERRAHEQELMHLNHLGEALMACQTPAEACDAFAIAAGLLFPGARGALALASPDIDRLLVMRQWGAEQPLLPQGFAPDACRALRARETCRCSTGAAGCAPEVCPPGVPHACIPLPVEGQSPGLFWLECADDETAAGRLQLALSAAETLKLAIANIHLREKLHEQAIRDTLTGLYNRRHLHEVFRREIAWACRSNQPLALVVLDIDHFKHVNDRYGHDAGDRALVALAQHLRESLRVSDFSFRLGGEEFVLLLRADMFGARRCAENLLEGFRDKRFRFHEDAPVHLTFSAGVVEAPLCGQDFDTLFKQADEALYRAKSGGRNRVEVASPLAGIGVTREGETPA